ncbi:MAG TPA: class I SAM-dependent methyltransferase [Coriobacteriia bacterium]
MPERADHATESAEYAERLVRLQTVWWKRILPVQAPYRWNLRRLDPGFTLDIGCGIGRNLAHIDGNGVGVDHNAEAVRLARARGFEALTPEEFWASDHARPAMFDSLLASHVAEHMTPEEFVELLRQYLPLLRANGRVILITPQEVGFRSDESHVTFVDLEALDRAGSAVGLRKSMSYSFPFPRPVGRVFVYNEFVWVGVADGSVTPGVESAVTAG